MNALMEHEVSVKSYLSGSIAARAAIQGSLFEPRDSKIEQVRILGETIPKYINEFWTSRQRQGASISEISYRACFKPQLPRFFIERLTREGDTVYDPFSGRGTTVLEAGLLGRKAVANDANPLSEILTRPRFFIPDRSRLKERLWSLPLQEDTTTDLDLSMFFHPKTLAEIISIRKYPGAKNLDRRRRSSGPMDSYGSHQPVDRPLSRFLLSLHSAS